jgi:hypothetical protein
VVFGSFLPVGLDLGNFSPSVLDLDPVIRSFLDFLLPCSDSFSWHRVSTAEAFSFPLLVFTCRLEIFLFHERSTPAHSPGHVSISTSGLHFAAGLVLPGPARTVLVLPPWILLLSSGLDAHSTGLLTSHHPRRVQVSIHHHQLSFGLRLIAAIRLSFVLFAGSLLGSFT